MKNRIFLILSLFFVVSFSVSCYVDTARDNPFDPENIDVLSDEDAVTTDKLNTSIVYSGTDTSSGVKQNITLPVTGANGTTISWSSSNPAVVSNTGVVTRPAYTGSNVVLTLTATIVKNSASDTRIFTITVLKVAATDAQCVADDKAALTIGYGGSDNSSSVTQNILLLTSGSSGTAISWSNTSVITNTGVVTRPDYYAGNATIVLTATITKNSDSDTKVFTLTVIKKPQTDAQAVAEDLASLTIGYSAGDSESNVRQNLTLSTSGVCGSTISWSSTNTSIISNTGLVNNPVWGSGDANIILTATGSKNGISGTKPFSLTVPQQHYIYAAIANGGGVSISKNNGLSWKNYTTANGLVGNYVNDIYGVGSTIYIATAQGLSKSTDSGNTWTNYTTVSGLVSNHVYDVYTSGSNIYVATNQGLSISTNNGSTWTNYTTANGLADHEVIGVYATGSSIYATTAGGLSKSIDNGNTWSIVNGMGGSLYPKDMFGAGSSLYIASGQYGIFVSLNSGITWTNYNTANGLGSFNVHRIFASGSNIYVATNGGLSMSLNNGSTWTNFTIANGLPNNYVWGVYAIGSTIYAALFDGGICISTNNGSTWTNYTTANGLSSNQVIAVYVY